MNNSLQHNAETILSDVSEYPSRTALVLGGGGSAGNAWLIGILAGMYEAGLDVTDADLVIGTSAGSTAAAQIAGATPMELLADVLAATPRPTTTSPKSHRVPTPPRLTADHLEAMRATIAAAEDAADMRRRMGAALQADPASDSATQTQWRTIVAARFPRRLWPQRRTLITAVDAHGGEPVVFDRHSGVDLVDAVAASCAGGFAYAIGGKSYIDGGYRSNADNADLAAGYERVLGLSPLGGKSWTPIDWGMHLATQIGELCAGGSSVETIFPDANSRAAFGDNLMDPSTRPPAASAGYDQGRTVAEHLTGFWLT